MVILNKIYTKTGDDGTTALGTGERRGKDDLRVAAYGTIDETNAAIGVARLHTGSGFKLFDEMLQHIQNDLFDLGADLAMPESDKLSQSRPLRISASQVLRIEQDIDVLNKQLSPLRTFVLPGGCAAAAHLHLARTIARRAERQIVALAATKSEPVNPSLLHYINRVSDFLFVAARYANDQGESDILWVPGQNR